MEARAGRAARPYRPDRMVVYGQVAETIFTAVMFM
jgi:hypothetical protein